MNNHTQAEPNRAIYQNSYPYVYIQVKRDRHIFSTKVIGHSHLSGLNPETILLLRDQLAPNFPTLNLRQSI